MKSRRIVKVSEKINPSFYSVWNAKESEVVLSGGRSSTKSSVISLKMVLDFMEDPNSNAVVLRKVGKYLSTSVYEQIAWAIIEMGLEKQFKFNKSPLVIMHKKRGTAFYFYGVDDPMKLKSAKIARGYVSQIWYEELAEFSGVEDIDTVQDTFIRQDIGKPVKTYYSYNPPRNPYNWVNKWAERKKAEGDVFFHHSTYLDDKRGFLSKQIVSKIENYRKVDHDYYRWMYLGEIIGLGDTVYNTNTFTPINYNEYLKKQNRAYALEDDPIMLLYFATDAGHQVSATTTLALGITRAGNVILINTYYYSPADKVEKKPPSELSRDTINFIDQVTEETGMHASGFTIDSAEGALRNQIFSDYGVRFEPVAKKRKLVMIDMATSIFSTGRFYYIDRPENNVFIDEHKRYAYEGKTLQTPDPRVIEVDDHTCDAFQYFTVYAARDLGLSW